MDGRKRLPPCIYQDCRFLYFQRLQDDPLYVKGLLREAGLRPEMKKFSDKYYFSCETDDGNVRVDANKLYVTVSWKWRRYDKIEDILKGLYNFRDGPSKKWEDILLKRAPLFWLSSNGSNEEEHENHLNIKIFREVIEDLKEKIKGKKKV